MTSKIIMILKRMGTITPVATEVSMISISEFISGLVFSTLLTVTYFEGFNNN